MNSDGVVIISTKMDTKQLERDLKATQNKLVKFEKEAERLSSMKAKAEIDLQPYEKEKALIEETTNESLKYAQSKEEVEANLKDESRQMEEINQKYAKQLQAIEDINNKIKDNAVNQGVLKQQAEEINQKLTNSKGWDNIKESISSASNGMSKVIKKVAKWALAIFSVRTAYSLISRAMSTLSEQNEELANKIQSIRIVLATALEPVINYIVNLIQRIVAYIGYIYKAWFGVDIFAQSTAKSMKSGAGYAEKMRKSLTGFDEMNVLGDNVGAAGGVGGGSLDLSGFDVEIPEWIEWIAQNKGTVLNTLQGILTMIAGFKLGGFVQELAGGRKGLDILIAGLGTVITQTTNLVRNWENMTTTEKIITGAFVVIGDAAITLGYAIATGFSTATLGIGALIAALVTAATVLGNLIIKDVEHRDIVMEHAEALQILKDAQSNLTNAYLENANAIDRAEQAEKNLYKAEQDAHMSGTELIKMMQDENKSYKDLDDSQKALYKAYYNNVAAGEQVEKTAKNITTATKDVMDAHFDEMRTLALKNGSWDEYKKAVIEALDSNQIELEDAQDYMNRAMKNMDMDAMTTFVEDIPNYIKEGLDPYEYNQNWELIGSQFSNGWKGIIANLEASWKSFINWFNRNSTVTAKVKTEWSSGSGNHYAYGKTGGIAMATGGIVKLASGAVVNRPGAGVPIKRNVYAGEAGAEGIIPLTDSQRMELLGEAIGRYININATVPVYVGNRQIAREIKRINAEDDFAYNR